MLFCCASTKQQVQAQAACSFGSMNKVPMLSPWRQQLGSLRQAVCISNRLSAGRGTDRPRKRSNPPRMQPSPPHPHNHKECHPASVSPQRIRVPCPWSSCSEYQAARVCQALWDYVISLLKTTCHQSYVELNYINKEICIMFLNQ